jgi:hypothetical protein
MRWLVALTGLFIATFALIALSGPGRIDIVDGQTRYEVARSLALHGDPIVRNPRVWFSVFPGRDGQRYSYYRLPHSVVGAPAIWIADLLGPESEMRRQFCFVLVSAGAAAALAAVYAMAFRDQGLSKKSACLWAIAGIVCTPNWFYATSTFDEIFGALTLVATVVAAQRSRTGRSVGWLVIAALLLGLAFNVKQPLGAFVLLAMALADDPRQSRKVRCGRAAVLAGGAALSVAFHIGYFRWLFPQSMSSIHGDMLKHYAPLYSGDPLSALWALAVSPGAGVFWYCPAIVVALAGLSPHWRENPRAAWAGLVASLAFIGMVCSLTTFKGDPAWGPRYLTPLAALGWLLVPAGAARLPRPITGLVLSVAAGIQVMALSVDPHRLFLEHRLPGAVLSAKLNFEPALSHLVQRPRELREVITSNAAKAADFTPADLPTSAPPLVEHIALDGRGPQRYVIFDTLRPWWVSFQHLPPSARPVRLHVDLLVFGGLFVCGLAMIGVGIKSARRATP